MRVFYGKGASGGIALGNVSVSGKDAKSIRRIGVKDTNAQLDRFERAKLEAKRQLSEIYERALAEVGRTNAEIFEIHMMMLDDEDYNESVRSIINGQRVNAEYAVDVTGENFARMFAAMDDAYMRARQTDVRDVSARLVRCMGNAKNDVVAEKRDVIVCAHDLTPSETVVMDKSKVLAFVTSRGSANSHTAILARSMGIPAVIGAGNGLLDFIKDGDFMIADGYDGRIIVNPDKTTVQAYLEKQRQDDEKKRLLKSLKGKENITIDGTRINVFANIGSADGLGDVICNDAGGIGLFRSEFLYLEKQGFPSEQEQFEVYKTVLESMSGKKVVIRTLDIGADKNADSFCLEREENPALGLRGIRLCLDRTDVFRTQLTALFRASVYGNLAIMFPMIADVWELEAAKNMCDEVKKELDDKGIEYSKSVEIGIMIETPAAAVISDLLSPLCDFFSIGTNDLTQYTLACDRQNPALDRFCSPHHEALLRLIGFAVESIHKSGGWAGICGELAADTSLTETFLKMGVDELSVSAGEILKIRDTIRKINLKGKQ